MRQLLLPLTSLAAFASATVFAADLTLRPGRWETTERTTFISRTRRTGPTCSASELAEQRAREE